MNEEVTAVTLKQSLQCGTDVEDALPTVVPPVFGIDGRG